jgi:hypothetical protein
MAISTYAELQAAVASWLDRGDLTTQIPDFIALAEADINSQFDLRTIESDHTLVTTVGSRFAPLPAGYREPQNVWLQWPSTAGREPLRMVPPELMEVSTVHGIPTAYGIDGDNIAFNCPVSSTTDYTFTFRQIGGVALSDTSPTNLVLTNYPNVYLYGALKAAAPFLRDPDAFAMWTSLYAEALGQAKAKESRGKALVTLSTEPGALTFAGRRDGFNIVRGY